jgi:hypothetical protein
MVPPETEVNIPVHAGTSVSIAAPLVSTRRRRLDASGRETGEREEPSRLLNQGKISMIRKMVQGGNIEDAADGSHHETLNNPDRSKFCIDHCRPKKARIHELGNKYQNWRSPLR